MSENKEIKNQNKNNNTEEEKGESHNGLALGMCFGMAIGLSVGQLLFHSMPIGMCFGMGIGMCFGTAYDAYKNKKQSDGGETDDAEIKQNPEAEPEEKKPESGEE
jgi:hypothetical protein